MSSFLDRLRETAIEEEDDLFAPELEDVVVDEQDDERLILGMNAAERMLLSIVLFITTSVLGTLLLIALGRIDIGI